jgi:hypothetical protein
MKKVRPGRPCRGIGADTIIVETEEGVVIAHVVERWRSTSGAHCILWESVDGAVFEGRFAPDGPSPQGRGRVTWA